MKLREKPEKFNTPAMAASYAARSLKPKMVFLGDDGLVWVVCPSDGSRLERAGYVNIKF